MLIANYQLLKNTKLGLNGFKAALQLIENFKNWLKVAKRIAVGLCDAVGAGFKIS